MEWIYILIQIYWVMMPQMFDEHVILSDNFFSLYISTMNFI